MKRCFACFVALLLLLASLLIGCGEPEASVGQLQTDTRKQTEAAATEVPEAQPEATAEPEDQALEPVQPVAEAQTYAAALSAAFAATGALDSMAPYSEADLLDYYGIDASACKSVVGYADAEGYVNELVIVEADEALAAEIYALLSGHLEDQKDVFASYDPDAATVVGNAVLLQEGGIVLMIVSPEADALKEIYRGFIF